MTVCAFQTPRPHARPKVMTVTRIVTLEGPIHVTVGTFETRRKHEEPNVTTDTRMAALRRQKRRQLRVSRPRRGPIPVTVGTFEGRAGTIPCRGWGGG